jgi:hypothetical protein
MEFAQIEKKLKQELLQVRFIAKVQKIAEDLKAKSTIEYK